MSKEEQLLAAAQRTLEMIDELYDHFNQELLCGSKDFLLAWGSLDEAVKNIEKDMPQEAAQRIIRMAREL